MFIVLECPLTDIAIIADVVGDTAIDLSAKALFLFAWLTLFPFYKGYSPMFTTNWRVGANIPL